VSVLPRPTVLKEIGVRTLAVVPLALPSLVRPIGIIHRRGQRFTPAVARFVELLQKADDGADSASA
jgi:DNA-binding transcriptional LysR family regulator